MNHVVFVGSGWLGQERCDHSVKPCSAGCGFSVWCEVLGVVMHVICSWLFGIWTNLRIRLMFLGGIFM